MNSVKVGNTRLAADFVLKAMQVMHTSDLKHGTVKILLRLLRSLYKTDMEVYNSIVMSLKELFSHNIQEKNLIHLIEAVDIWNQASSMPTNQETRLRKANCYEDAARIFENFRVYRHATRLRLKAAKLRAVYYSHIPEKLKDAADQWTEALTYAERLNDQEEIQSISANLLETKAEIKLTEILKEKPDKTEYVETAKLFDEAAKKSDECSKNLTDEHKRKQMEEQARICAAFANMCRFFANPEEIHYYERFKEVIDEVLEISKGSERAKMRRILRHFAEREWQIVILKIGKTLCDAVWNKYRELEAKLNKISKDRYWVNDNKPLDYYLGIRKRKGILRDHAPKALLRVFDEIYSNFKHIEGEDVYEADEQTYKRAVELREDIVQLDRHINNFINQIQRRNRY